MKRGMSQQAAMSNIMKRGHGVMAAASYILFWRVSLNMNNGAGWRACARVEHNIAVSVRIYGDERRMLASGVYGAWRGVGGGRSLTLTGKALVGGMRCRRQAVTHNCSHCSPFLFVRGT